MIGLQLIHDSFIDGPPKLYRDATGPALVLWVLVLWVLVLWVLVLYWNAIAPFSAITSYRVYPVL